METKIIILEEPCSQNIKMKTKTIKEKEKQKRKITTTDKWNFTDQELNFENHYTILYDPSKTQFIYQQIKNKLSGYRSQDIEKGLLNIILRKVHSYIKMEFWLMEGVLR
jgi:hypothetical protein